MKPARSTIFLAAFLALGSLFMIGSGIYLLVERSNDLAKIGDWKRAATCSEATVRVADCRATLDATVTGIRLDNRPPELDLLVGATSYHPDFYHSRIGPLRGIKVGDRVPVELWRGKIVVVGGAPAQGNPDLISNMATSPIPGIALIVIGAVIGVPSVYVLLQGLSRR